MEPNQTILHVDPDSALQLFLQEFLGDLGYTVLHAADAVDARRLFLEHHPDVTVVDHRPPQLDGLLLVRQLHEIDPGALTMMTSASATLENARLAADAGSREFLPKPFHALFVHLAIQRLLQLRRMDAENRRFAELLERRNYLGELIGGSPPMRSLYQLIDEVAGGDIPALVVGGPGTEKLATARTIHLRSPRSGQNLVELHLDREEAGGVAQRLFGGGLEPGGGGRLVPSLIEQADGGTLLIGEVGRLDTECQLRLIEVLQDRQLRRPLSSRPRRVSFRLITTSSDDLFQMVEAGTFRRDLYYRINVVQIMVPSLHERLEDIPVLAHHFLKQANKRLGTRVEDIHLEALLTLVTYRWPGNLVELEAVINRACEASERGIITRQHLPIELYQAAAEQAESDSFASISFKEAKSRFEVQYFTDLLRKTQGNMTQAADLSKVGRPYLYKKLQEHTLRPSEFRMGRRRASTSERRAIELGD